MTRPDSGAKVGGVVLAGGAATRLGVDKASLDWHGTPLAERVARLLSRALGGGPVVVVGPADGRLPDLPGRFETAFDRDRGEGPLAGLIAGLESLAGRVEAAVAVPCDLPLLHPAFARLLASRVLHGTTSVACVVDEKGRPLALPGAWRLDALGAAAEAFAGGERSPSRVAANLNLAGMAEAELRSDPALADSDPRLDSLSDIDTPGDLERLLGLAPKIRLARDRRLSTTAAWTLGELASVDGSELDGPCVVNGLPVEFDPRFPLAWGDSVSLPASGRV